MEISIALSALLVIASSLLKPTTLPSLIAKTIGYVLLLYFSKPTHLYQQMLILIAVFHGLVTSLYTIRYSELRYQSKGLIALLDLFAISLCLVFMSNVLLEFIALWLLTELIGFVLIAFDYVKEGNSPALNAAVKYLVFSMIPTDITLFIILSLVGFDRALTGDMWMIKLDLSNPILTALVILGFFSKAAIFPLHFWLPDAHSVAPSPASALLSGIMVKMGIYGLYLSTFFNLNKTIGFWLMITFSLITTIYGALQASLQSDMKRLLAYSTTANTALASVFLALYMYTGEIVFLEASLTQTLAHAVYKATLFLDAGYVEMTTGTRELNKLGYIHKLNPVETAIVISIILGVLGLPPSMGFFAKILAFTSVSKSAGVDPLLFTVLCIMILNLALSIVYNLRYIRAHVSHEVRVLVLHAKTVNGYFNALLGISCLWMFILPFTMIFSGTAGFVEPLIIERGFIVLVLSMISVIVILRVLVEIMERKK